IEDRENGHKSKANEAIYTFVAVDDTGKPVAVPAIIPETPLEKERYDAALRRKRSEEHTSELQSRENLVCRLLLEKKKKKKTSLLGRIEEKVKTRDTEGKTTRQQWDIRRTWPSGERRRRKGGTRTGNVEISGPRLS